MIASFVVLGNVCLVGPRLGPTTACLVVPPLPFVTSTHKESRSIILHCYFKNRKVKKRSEEV